MNDLYQNLKDEFRKDPDYRYGYAESFLNTKLATQIKTLREQRGKTQAEIGASMGIKQPGYRRFEDVNHSVWRTDTLWGIARALGVRLNIGFETFGSLLEEKKRFSKHALERPPFEEDPVFHPQNLHSDANAGYLTAYTVLSSQTMSEGVTQPCSLGNQKLAEIVDIGQARNTSTSKSKTAYHRNKGMRNGGTK